MKNRICLVTQWRIQDFPLGGGGGAQPRWGWRGHFSAKTYAETKELGSVVAGGGGVLPGSANMVHLPVLGTLTQFYGRKSEEKYFL